MVAGPARLARTPTSPASIASATAARGMRHGVWRAATRPAASRKAASGPTSLVIRLRRTPVRFNRADSVLTTRHALSQARLGAKRGANVTSQALVNRNVAE